MAPVHPRNSDAEEGGASEGAVGGRALPERAPGEWIVRLASHLLPWTERRAWTDEWEAELGSTWDRRAPAERTLLARAALTMRALGALPDALEIRGHHHGNGMLAHDLRFALRRLRFRPGFALLVTLTLALGIGAATTVFTVVDSVLLRPLPFADADRLVELNSRMRSGFRTPYIAPEAVDEWEQQVTVLRDVARYNSMSVVLETGEPIELAGAEVSQGLFSLLGIPPRLGRTFAPEEVESGARVVIVSDEFWRSQLGADRDVIGREIALSGERHTIVGVMPASFRFPRMGVSV